MKNRNVTYVELYKGNMLLLVPTVRDSGFAGMKNQVLWSLREFDFKVFAYVDPEYLISYIINERAAIGLPFYDIEVDMYNPTIYPETLESVLKNSWDYAVMRQAHRYFDQLTKNFLPPTPSAFVVSCGWHSNSHQALQIFPLDDQYLGIKDTDQLCILFSSYDKYTEENIERLMVKIGKCQKLHQNYVSWKPTKNEYKTIYTQHFIKKYNAFFLFENGGIYCGLSWISPDILLKVSWELFANEMIHPKGCKECNPGYKMKICLPEDGMVVFNHKLFKDYAKNINNDCYSKATQFINIICSQWERIKEERPHMKKLIFELKYDDTKRGRGEYLAVQYVNNEWIGPSREIVYTNDSDYILQKKEEIAKAL